MHFIDKLKYFYFNKYVLTPVSQTRYHLSYDLAHRALWFRVPKAASRTINHHFETACDDQTYIYGSAVAYRPSMFDGFFKFAFVRNPESRLISAWKDLVLRRNYFGFNKKNLDKMKNLSAFVSWVSQQDIQRCDIHLREQSSLIDLNNIDFLGRLETFDRDFEYVAEQIGLQEYEPEAQLNSATAHYTLSEEDRLRIADIYIKDFQFFYPEHLNTLNIPLTGMAAIEQASVDAR